MRLSSQVGLLFLTAFLLTLAIAKIVAVLGFSLGGYGDFSLAVLLLGFAILVGLLAVQLCIVRPLELLRRRVEDPSLSEKIPSYASEEIQKLEKTIEQGYSVEQVVSKAQVEIQKSEALTRGCLLYTSPSPRDGLLSRMPSSA